MKLVDLREPTSFLYHVYLGCTQRECKSNESIIEEDRKMFASRISVGATEKYLVGTNRTRKQLVGLMTWKVMRRNAWNDVANKNVEQLYEVSTPCLDDHHYKKEELETVGELSKVCSQIVLKCLYFARIGIPDTVWSVNKLARAVTKWTRACDKR